MKRLAVLCFSIVLLAGISGCANNSPDGLVKQQIALVNEQSDAIEKNAPKSTLDAIKAKQDDLKKKMEALKMSDEEKKKVMEQNKDASEKAIKRLIEVSMKKATGDMKGLIDKKGK